MCICSTQKEAQLVRHRLNCYCGWLTGLWCDAPALSSTLLRWWLRLHQPWRCGSKIDHHKLQHEANRFIDQLAFPLAPICCDTVDSANEILLLQELGQNYGTHLYSQPDQPDAFSSLPSLTPKLQLYLSLLLPSNHPVLGSSKPPLYC